MLLYDRFEQVPRDGKEALQLALLLHVESYLRESLNLSHELDQLTGLDLAAAPIGGSSLSNLADAVIFFATQYIALITATGAVSLANSAHTITDPSGATGLAFSGWFFVLSIFLAA